MTLLCVYTVYIDISYIDIQFFRHFWIFDRANLIKIKSRVLKELMVVPIHT